MLTKSFSKSKGTCKVTFSLPLEAAKEGSEVRILGDFNAWSWENGVRMNADKQDYSAVLELPAGKEYQFRYLIDNHRWENDWKADDYVKTEVGTVNSLVSLVQPKEAIAAKPMKAASKTAAKASTDKAAPAAKSAVRPVGKKTAEKKTGGKQVVNDDLTRIEGVGPKIAELLKMAGIETFAALAKSEVATLKAVLDKAGKRYQMHDPASWPTQAKLAAKSDWKQLEQLQGTLKGGK
ncbi:MAG: hypothetical protein RLY31_3079 [Bacteroidota bacterium]|jgi:predicted flap endonuclease-1-like 5' DNA nuclease